MKKLFYSCLFLVAGLLVTSCSEDIENVAKNNDGKGVTLSTIISDGIIQKTVLSGESAPYQVLWQSGDKVAINGEASNEVASQFVNTNNASFTTTASVEAPYNVLYPASAYDAKSGNINIPVTQEYVSGSFANGADVMVGQTSDITVPVSMKHLSSFVKINLTEDVDQIALETNNNEPISGIFEVAYNEPAIKSIAGQDIVRITNIPASARTFIIAVPAANYSKGFTVKMYKGAKAYKKSAYSAEGKELVPGYILNMPEITPSACEELNETLIATADQLVEFLANAENANKDAIVTADLDMEGKIVTPMTSYSGTFDGQGYSIKNWTNEGTGLFALNLGTIKNIVLDKSCTFSYSNTPVTYNAFIVQQNGDKASTINGYVKGCINYADVNATISSITASGRFGTIVGATVYGEAESCVNYGNININVSSRTATVGYGTVQGYMVNDQVAKIIKCVNYGNLTIIEGSTPTTYIGGVTGTSNSQTFTLNCQNYGNITFRNTTTTGATCMGGITAYSASRIDDCINCGDITFISKATASLDDAEADGGMKATLIGGIAGYASYHPTQRCINNGKITIRGGYFTGRNNLGGLYYNNAEKSADGAMFQFGGIVGACGAKSAFYDCENNGEIDVIIGHIEKGTSTQGRQFVGGIVGTPWGNVERCVNNGDIHYDYVTSTGEVYSDENRMMGCAGIVGGDYCALTQNTCNIIDCVNNGNIDVRTDGTKSNSTVGGIISWPGIEQNTQTTVTKNCINNGNITVNGRGKLRIGGIQGGSGPMQNCINNGNVTVGGDLDAASVVGGVSGFTTRNHATSNCKNFGNVSSRGTSYVGGLFGQLHNYASTHIGHVVNCNVNGTSGKVGLLIGYCNVTNVAVTVGTEENPCIVSGSLNGTTIDAENLAENIYGLPPTSESYSSKIIYGVVNK